MWLVRSARLCSARRPMAGFAARGGDGLLDAVAPADLSSGVRSVVGWLKQASLEVRGVVSSLRGGAAGAGPDAGGGGDMDSVLLLHFNDVYNIEQTTNTEPVGGALRFSSAVKALRHRRPLVLFSGDVFSPSMLSTFTQGEQMVPVLNEVGTACAVFGNHDFDFGLGVLSKLTAGCRFPWLMSNVVDRETGRPLGDGKITHAEHTPRTIGFIGLVEQEWLDTLATINAEEVTYIDFVEAGTQLARQLKQEGCELVVALTHMRTRNDIRLAESCPDIDLILGGHDHVYEVKEVNGTLIVKSGTDFRQFSEVEVRWEGEGKPRVSVRAHDVTTRYPEDPVLKEVLDKYSAMVEGKLDNVLGRFSVPLDGRFSTVRTQESNLGSWLCDVVLAATSADLVILNSGTFRSDRIHPAGPFTLRDLCSVIPMRDPIVVLQATGAQVLAALENAVSQYPSLEGRFPQVAGISFAFDPSKPAGSRVVERFVRVGDEYLDRTQSYRLAVKQYLRQGSDGFTVLRDCPVLVEEDMCPELGLCVQNHFAAIEVRAGRAHPSRHRQSLVTLSRRHSLVKNAEAGGCGGEGQAPSLRRSNSLADAHPPSLHSRLSRRASLDELEQQSCELAPRVEGRIIVLDSPEVSHTQTSVFVSSRLSRRASLDELEQQSCELAPRVEGRIIVLDSPEVCHTQTSVFVSSRLSRRASLDELEQQSCELTPRVEGRIIVLDLPEVCHTQTSVFVSSRLSRRASLDELEQQSCEQAPRVEGRIIVLDSPEVCHTQTSVFVSSRLSRRASLDELEQQSCELAPRVEGRIIVLDSPEKWAGLEAERARAAGRAADVIREVDEPDV